MLSSLAVNVRMLCLRSASFLSLVFMISPYCVVAAAIGRLTINISYHTRSFLKQKRRASQGFARNVGTGCPGDLARVMTIEKAQQHELMGPCGRAQQPNGVQVAEAAQQILERLGQQAAPVPVGQLGQ